MSNAAICPSCHAPLGPQNIGSTAPIICGKCGTKIAPPQQSPFGNLAPPQPTNPYAPPGANPFGDGPVPGYFPAPYDSAAVRRYARSRVQGPAILLMVTGLLLIVSAIGSAFLGGAIYLEDPDDGEGLAVAVLFVVIAAICLVSAAVLVFAGNRMRQLRSYGLAMTATIITLVVGFLVCVPAALAGIWPLVVLLDYQVKQGFALPPTPDEA